MQVDKNIITRQISVIAVALFVFTTFGITACDMGADTEPGTLQIRMHDEPMDADALNVEIVSVEVHRDGGSWETVNEPNEVYNLLELVNGAHVVLGEAQLEAGRYTQIRLMLGEDNSVVKGEDVFNLTVPSGVQTGIILPVNVEIQEGIDYILNLDFDASKSVQRIPETPAPNDVQEYILRPVIRAYAEGVNGNITGQVNPAEAEARIDAIVADTVYTSTFIEENTGEFMLRGLEEQVYNLLIEAREGDFESATLDNVEVTAGESTDVGTIELQAANDDND